MALVDYQMVPANRVRTLLNRHEPSRYPVPVQLSIAFLVYWQLRMRRPLRERGWAFPVAISFYRPRSPPAPARYVEIRLPSGSESLCLILLRVRNVEDNPLIIAERRRHERVPSFTENPVNCFNPWHREIGIRAGDEGSQRMVEHTDQDCLSTFCRLGGAKQRNHGFAGTRGARYQSHAR